jgi:hypothetical protein
MTLLSLFTGLEASPVGVFMKDKPATFATVESIHLLALAVLGSSVVLTDLRLMGVVMRDISSKTVTDGAYRWFKWSLGVLLVTGFFMLAGVATKCYHNPYYWVKMAALLLGIVFAFAIKRPLLSGDHAQLKPLTLKLVGAASLMVWFVVAASGRWIGYS